MIIGFIVDALHVSATDADVVRTLYRKLKLECRRDPALRKDRRKMYHDAIKRHRANQKLYKYVMKR